MGQSFQKASYSKENIMHFFVRKWNLERPKQKVVFQQAGF